MNDSSMEENEAKVIQLCINGFISMVWILLLAL